MKQNVVRVQCDRCKTVVENVTKDEPEWWPAGWRGAGRGMIHTTLTSYPLHLCRRCDSDLLRFFEGEELSEDNPAPLEVAS